MARSLAGRFEIEVTAETRLASLRLLLDADNVQEGDTIQFGMRVHRVEVRRGRFHLEIPAHRFAHVQIKGKRGTLRSGRFIAEPVALELPRVYLGYDLRAELRMDGAVADDFDSYSGEVTFNFKLKGPVFLPDFSDEKCVGTFVARRVPEPTTDAG